MKTGIKIIFLLTILATSAVMFYIPYTEVKRNSIGKLNERQMLLARQAALGIESFFREQRNLLLHFASNPSFVKLTEMGRDAIRREYENHKYAVRAITVYDDKGIIRYSYPQPERVIGMDISYQPHVSKILKNRETNVSDVFRAVQGYKAVALSEPIFVNGSFEGVIAFLIDFEYIAKTFLSDIKIGEDGYAWMLSRDGTEIYCPVPGHAGEGVEKTAARYPGLMQMTEEMLKGRTGTAAYKYDMLKGEFMDPVTKHAAYHPVKIFDNLWSVAVATPESEIYTGLGGFFRKMTISVAVLFVVLMLFGWSIYRDYNLKNINAQLEKRVESEMGKRIQQEKLMLQQARFYSMGETMNAIAHQWRQPLNAIGLCIQELEDTVLNGTPDKEYVEKMTGTAMGSLNDLSATIDDFKNFFTQTEKPVSTNVCDVLHSVKHILGEQFRGLRINLDLAADDECTDVGEGADHRQFDAVLCPDMLKQVILNCLQNSREAVEKRRENGFGGEGKILLKAKRAGDTISISIRDNGGGIPEGVLDKVFDPYFTTKSGSIGLGLGLYVSKNILEDQMAGSIDIANFEDGAKTTIRFKVF